MVNKELAFEMSDLIRIRWALKADIDRRVKKADDAGYGPDDLSRMMMEEPNEHSAAIIKRIDSYRASVKGG